MRMQHTHVHRQVIDRDREAQQQGRRWSDIERERTQPRCIGEHAPTRGSGLHGVVRSHFRTVARPLTHTPERTIEIAAAQAPP